MDIKNRSQIMPRIGLQIPPIPVLLTLIEIIVLRNELLELGLHLYYPLCGEVGFYDGDAGGFQVREESIDGILAPERRAEGGYKTTARIPDFHPFSFGVSNVEFSSSSFLTYTFFSS
jgi:hypothetical protein